MRVLALASTLAVVVAVGPTRPVGALGDGGASSRVVGRGNIVTSILGWTGPSRARPVGAAPACAWRTLTDAQLEWLVSVAAQASALGLSAPMLDPLRRLADAEVLPDGDLQGYVCGLQTHELRFVPSPAQPDPTQVLLRRMITRLPAPEPRISPPPAAAVPVGQPVFVSIEPGDWSAIEASLTYAGTTAEVRAVPVQLRVITGDPKGTTVTCDGPGRAFRPGTGSSPLRQARAPGACTTTYRSPSAGPAPSGPDGTSGPSEAQRPPVWLGTVTVVWQAQWRTDGGAWNDLGRIPRTRLIAREVREVATTLERG